MQTDTLIILLLIACATALCVKWIKMPYAVALVIAGLVIGLLRLMPPVAMTPDLILVVFLPALLFEASWNLDIDLVRKDWLAVGILATVGVIVCMACVAAILHYCFGFGIGTSLLFGSIVSATDPVSVVSLFRKLGINKRLTMLLEAESLFNDGTAVVLFRLVLAAVITGTEQIPLVSTALSFVWVCLGGTLVGALIGYAVSRLTRDIDDHLLENTLTMVTAYGSFLVADHLQVSPVLSVVAAGIVVGNYGSKGMSTMTRYAVNSFWEYAAFLVNSLLFLLIGLQIRQEILVHNFGIIILGVISVVIARAIVVYGLTPFISFVSESKKQIPLKWRHLLFWGGLRGALSMALALSLPTNLPSREIIINMTFGVVLFTLLVPGLSMELLAKFLRMEERESEETIPQTQSVTKSNDSVAN